MQVYKVNKKLHMRPFSKGPWKVFSLSKDGCTPYLVSRRQMYEGQAVYRSYQGAILKCSEANIYWWIGFKAGYKAAHK